MGVVRRGRKETPREMSGFQCNIGQRLAEIINFVPMRCVRQNALPHIEPASGQARTSSHSTLKRKFSIESDVPESTFSVNTLLTFLLSTRDVSALAS